MHILRKAKERNTFSTRSKEWLLFHYDNRCAYCNEPLTVDNVIMEHIVPFRLSRSNELHQLAPSCAKCNQIKGATAFFTIKHARLYITLDRWIDKLPFHAPYLRLIYSINMPEFFYFLSCSQNEQDSLYLEYFARENADNFEAENIILRGKAKMKNLLS